MNALHFRTSLKCILIYISCNGLLKREVDKCLISLSNQIGIETGNRKESESKSIKFKPYPTLLSMGSNSHASPQATVSCGALATTETDWRELEAGTLEKAVSLEHNAFSRRLSQCWQLDRPLNAAWAWLWPKQSTHLSCVSPAVMNLSHGSLAVRTWENAFQWATDNRNLMK